MHEQPYDFAPSSAPTDLGPPPAPTRGPPTNVSALAAALAAFVGAGLAIAGYAPAHAHPRSAIRHWLTVMSAGDVATLRSDERLGMQAWTSSLVQELGERDFQRTLAIFDRATQLGQQEFARLRTAAIQGGRAAFEALPWDQQQSLSRQSHTEWVSANGFAQVTEASVAGTWQALFTEPPAADLLQRLGTAALSADEQSLLANRAANDPAVLADPMLVALVDRRSSEGQVALRRLRSQVEREGEHAFRRLAWSAQQEIDGRSRARFTAEQGFAALSPADRARIGSADALNDTTNAVAERLGRQLLPPAEQREVASWTRATFAAGRATRVESAGTRLAQETLRGEFSESRIHYERFDVSGVGGRDLIRRERAHAELFWDQVGVGLRQLPASIELRWTPRSADWRVVEVRWGLRPGADEPAAHDAETPAAAPQMNPTSAPTGDDSAEGTHE